MAEIIGITKVDLKKLREAAGLTQKELARLVGLDEGYFNRLENGVIRISPTNWKKIEGVLNKKTK